MAAMPWEASVPPARRVQVRPSPDVSVMPDRTLEPAPPLPLSQANATATTLPAGGLNDAEVTVLVPVPVPPDDDDGVAASTAMVPPLAGIS